jgi:hypothetical protein
MSTDPLPGTLFLVAPTELNMGNSFWCRLVSKRATLMRVEPDGLWMMLVDDGGFANPVEGAKPERFVLAPASEKPMVLSDADVPMGHPVIEARKSWWKRFFTWLGE